MDSYLNTWRRHAQFDADAHSTGRASSTASRRAGRCRTGPQPGIGRLRQVVAALLQEYPSATMLTAHPDLAVFPHRRVAMVRGRVQTHPPGPAATRLYKHGGLSLMEMLTPWIVLDSAAA